MVTIQERTLSVWRDQIQSRVKVAGQGPPLVFLHGATGLKWDDFLDNLSQTHTVYAPEHPGTTPGDPDAIKPLDDLWDLVLYYYEIFYPKRVGKLVLLSPLGLWRDDTPVKNAMSMAPDDTTRFSTVWNWSRRSSWGIRSAAWWPPS